MNSATLNLVKDHDYILRLLDVMEKITALNKDPEINDLDLIVSLIRNFADGFHHAKEENILFPALAPKGLSPYQGPVAVMLSEHTQGRNYVASMAKYIDLYRNGDKDSLKYIHENMTGYLQLLRNHIAKENNILFRMADNVLTEEENKILLQKYTDVTSGAALSFETVVSQIEKLEKKYSE